MSQVFKNQRGFTWRLVAAGVVSFLVQTLYLFFSRWPSYRVTEFSNYAGLAVSVLVGVPFIATLPLRVDARILAAIIYIAAILPLLWFYNMFFAAFIFNEWK